MKELSIEEKTIAYDYAYKKVAVRFGSNVADEIFLKESEDERIRKDIIQHFAKGIEGSSFEEVREKYKIWIAWLEKQGKCEADCPQNHQDVNHPNGCITMEDFSGGEGFYKLNIEYLNKRQVEEIEEIVRTWNKDVDCGLCTSKEHCISIEKQDTIKDGNSIDPHFFGASDSELMEATYFIPQGYHAVIYGDKVIIKKGEAPVSNDLEEFAKRESELFGEREYEIDFIDKNALAKGYYWGAKAGAQWQKSKDESSTEDLEEESKKYSSCIYLEEVLSDGDKEVLKERLINTFKAGAEWQKEQMKEALRTEYEKGRHDALEETKKSR